MNIDDPVEAEIDALLARDDTASVIDALMSMPHITAGDSDSPWQKILHARLQVRLARKMRQVLEGDQAQTDTRSAA